MTWLTSTILTRLTSMTPLTSIGCSYENVQALGRLTFVEDLEYFEGSILSKYTFDDAVYIEKWCDCDDGLSRFMLVESTEQRVNAYLAGRLTMLQFLTAGKDFVLVVDRRQGIIEDVRLCRLYEIPPGYLPTRGCYHDEGLRPR